MPGIIDAGDEIARIVARIAKQQPKPPTKKAS